MKSLTTMRKTKFLRTIVLPAESQTQLIKNSTEESAKKMQRLISTDDRESRRITLGSNMYEDLQTIRLMFIRKCF
jgi:hypothetical protein